MKYNKIVELPTGVETKISDTLDGTVSVKFKLMDVFNNPIKKNPDIDGTFRIEPAQLCNE